MPFPQFTDAFGADFDPLSDDADWDDQSSGTDHFSVGFGVLSAATAGGGASSNATFASTVDTISQCVLLQLAAFDTAGTYGAMFRQADADGLGAHNVATVRWSGSRWDFSCERYTGTSFQESINTRLEITVPGATDYIGFAITGTDSSTVFDYWDFGTSDPGEFSTWGAATQSSATTASTHVDSGSYVGVWHFNPSGGNAGHSATRWWGGDQAGAGDPSGLTSYEHPLRRFQPNLMR